MPVISFRSDPEQKLWHVRQGHQGSPMRKQSRQFVEPFRQSLEKQRCQRWFCPVRLWSPFLHPPRHEVQLVGAARRCTL